MTRGRKAVPAEIKAVTGVQSRPAKPKAGKEAKGRSLGAPFPSMDARAKEIWAEVAEEWQLVLSRTDRRAVRLYCEAWVEMETALARVETNGAMVMTPNGLVQKSPCMTMIEQRREFLRKMLSEFGGSPSSRSKVAGGDGDDESDPLDRFLN